MRIVDAHVHLWDVDAVPIPWFRDDLGLPRHAAAADLGRELTDAGVSSAIAVQAADSVAEAEWLTATAARDPYLRRVVLQYTPAPGRAAAPPQSRSLPPWSACAPRCRSTPLTCPMWTASTPSPTTWARPPAPSNCSSARSSFPPRPPSPDGTPAPRSSSATSASAHGRPMPHGSPPSPRPRRLRECRRRSPGSTSRRAGADESQELLRSAFTLFGADRLMFGSDWPMSTRTTTYAEVLAATRRALPPLSPSEARAFWSGTADRLSPFTA